MFDRCLDLRVQIAQDVGKWGGVETVTDNVAQPILRIITESEYDKNLQPYTFITSASNNTPDTTIIKAEGMDIVVVSDATNIKDIKKQYQEYSNKLVTGEMGVQISAIYHELKDKLEPKIKDSLQEILHRRDYIMTTCRLCPGQPKLLRK